MYSVSNTCLTQPVKRDYSQRDAGGKIWIETEG